MRTPEDKTLPTPSAIFAAYHVIDFELCEDVQQLRRVLATVNRRGYQVVSVTQAGDGVYTVFFRRCVIE